VQPSWIEINEVPRRLIIHFFNEFTDEDIKELTNNIRILPSYESIFLIGDSKKQLRSNHQKGHVNKDGVYIKHTEIKGKKKVRNQNNRPNNFNKQRYNNDPNQIKNKRPHQVDYKMFSIGGLGGMSKGLGQGGYRPSIPQVGQMGSNMPFLHQGMQGPMSSNLPGMLPPTGLPGSLPPSISTNLPGTLPSNIGAMRLGIGSQPPSTGQQPPLGSSLAFKPPGMSGMPGMQGMSGMPGMQGMSGMSGMPGIPGMSGMTGLPGITGFTGIVNLPGANISTLPGSNPLGLKPPGIAPINPYAGMMPKPGQK